MDTLLQDLRYALRTLARSPGFTAAAVIALALRIGGTGAPHEVVLTDRLWKREFAGDPRSLGQTTTLNGRTYTLAGVLPAGFRFPLLRNAEALIPFEWDEKDLKNRGMHSVGAFARMRPGVSERSAQADLAVIGPRIAARALPDHTGWSQRAVPLQEDLVGPVKPALQALLGAVVLVLLIACANVASMLLARGAVRQRELAIRSALGSGRGRILRQLLTEALLLALAGGALGVRLAAWGLDALVALAPRTIPRLDEVHLNGPVLIFALAVSVASGVIAGLVPALHASRPDLVEALKNGAAGATSRGRARAVLVVAEVALALILVIGAGLMIRTLNQLLGVRSGLSDPAHVLVTETVLPKDKYPTDETISAFQRQLLQRAAALPGVKSAAIMTSVPLDRQFNASLGFEIKGEPPQPPGEGHSAEVVWTTPGYLETLGIPLLQGRTLGSSEDQRTPPVVLVNQAFVNTYLGKGEAVGRRLVSFRKDNDSWEIVGVVGDVHTLSLDRAPQPQVIVASAQWPLPFLRVVLRTSARPLDLVPLLRTELQAIDKDQPLAHPRLLEDVVSESLGERRFPMLLLTVFGCVALVHASLGIYGVMAYSVAQRAKEIGIRMELGAPAAQVSSRVRGGG